MNIPFFRSAARTTDGQMLTVPLHELINNRYQQGVVVPVLQKAADTIVSSGLVWRWNRYTGEKRLVRWHDNHFIGDSIDGWREWLGERWQIIDTNGYEWLGPSRSVCARLVEAVLDHPKLPLASFQLQDQMQRRAGK